MSGVGFTKTKVYIYHGYEDKEKASSKMSAKNGIWKI